MAYLLSNIRTKNYWNRTTIVEIIISGWVVSFFETQCSNGKGYGVTCLQETSSRRNSPRILKRETANTCNCSKSKIKLQQDCPQENNCVHGNTTE